MSDTAVRHRVLLSWLTICLVVVNLGLLTIVVLRPDQLGHIYFFNVGQGDAILIKTANNHHILIDGGPDHTIIEQLDTVIPPWQRTLDLVILTHPHADHATGLLAVLEQYHIDQLWYTGTDYSSQTYQTLVQQLSLRQVPTQFANQGDSYHLDSVSLDVLSPIVEHPVAEDPNETSVVSLLRYHNFSILFTGDATAHNEAVYSSLVPDVDIIKIPHHGSQGSSSAALLSAARPEVGMIMVGASNSFGHPHPDTLAHYQSLGTTLYRTDQDGTTEVVTDGQRYQII